MSGRLVRRVLRSQQHEGFLANSKVSVQDDTGVPDSTHDVASNPFDLLGTQDEMSNVELEDLSVESSCQKGCSWSPSTSSTKLNKKKSKKKGKPKAVIMKVEADNTDVDQLLERLVLRQKGRASTVEASNHSRIKSANVLAVDPKHLKAEVELKRIFGSKVINAVERSNRIGGNFHGSGAMQRGNRGMPLRRTTLVTPMEYWPRWDGSISMECTGPKYGSQSFRYVFSPLYMEVQQKFEASGALYDPNTIALLLARQPYHLESLLALAEVYTQIGEHQQSVECLERCLYALECAWHPAFNPFQGICKLPFSCETNRPFFLALFKHMQQLGRRGCHHSALEICKLLLSLDADDPLGALFCIDYYALRAEQFEWLERFAETYSCDNSLALFPNFSFSLAVARFHLEQHSTTVQAVACEREESVSSCDLLKQALMLHPVVLKQIVERAPIKEDSQLAKILKHSHFLKATPGGPSLKHLISLYVERNYLIWRVPELQLWLKAAASAVIQAADGNSGEVQNWACVRKEAFQSEKNEYRHLHLSDFSDSAPSLPPDELQQMLFHGDGEGIRAGVDGFVNEGHQVQGHEVTLEGRNAILVFLQSLLPWSDYGVDLHGQDPEHIETAADNADHEEH